MLYFNFKSVFEARQIERPHAFLVNIGISASTAQKILRNDSHVLRLDNLEKICTALYCDPNDVIAYKPNVNHPIPDHHPLKKLIPQVNDDEWQQQLKTMPLKKLRQIGSIIKQANDLEDKQRLGH